MSFLIGVLIFVAALLISIMLHEAGHFVTAKAFGMKATQFFLGFGTTLWSRKRGETEYGIKALPLGGFVKITGMTTLDEVDPADEPRSFRNKPGWQRVIVLAAGSFMHFALALVLLVVLAVGVGLPNDNTTTITVLGCVPKTQTAGCAAADRKSPAVLGGLRTGDTVIAVAGRPVANYVQLGKAIRAQPPGRPVPFTIQRAGRRLTKMVTLAAVRWRVKQHSTSFLGVQPTPVFQPPSVPGAFSFAGREFGTILTQSASAAAKLPAAIPNLFSKNRAQTGGGVTSVVGVAGVTGQVVAASGSWQQKVATILLIVASLNIFVGAFNLLPLLPLDGGHLAVVLFERARAWLARLRRRPDPGPVNMQRLVPVSVGVFAVLVGLGMLLILADIVNPLTLS
jgi:membrane-associated protease RseP (regulator of RpoE activity)